MTIFKDFNSGSLFRIVRLSLSVGKLYCLVFACVSILCLHKLTQPSALMKILSQQFLISFLSWIAMICTIAACSSTRERTSPTRHIITTIFANGTSWTQNLSVRALRTFSICRKMWSINRITHTNDEIAYNIEHSSIMVISCWMLIWQLQHEHQNFPFHIPVAWLFLDCIQLVEFFHLSLYISFGCLISIPSADIHAVRYFALHQKYQKLRVASSKLNAGTFQICLKSEISRRYIWLLISLKYLQTSRREKQIEFFYAPLGFFSSSSSSLRMTNEKLWKCMYKMRYTRDAKMDTYCFFNVLCFCYTLDYSLQNACCVVCLWSAWILYRIVSAGFFVLRKHRENRYFISIISIFTSRREALIRTKYKSVDESEV